MYRTARANVVHLRYDRARVAHLSRGAMWTGSDWNKRVIEGRVQMFYFRRQMRPFTLLFPEYDCFFCIWCACTLCKLHLPINLHLQLFRHKLERLSPLVEIISWSGTSSTWGTKPGECQIKAIAASAFHSRRVTSVKKERTDQLSSLGGWERECH